MKLTLSELAIANRIRNEHWDPDSVLTAEFKGNELGGECGEAQNKIKKLARERLGLRGSRATVDELAEELADVIICASLIANHFGIDLDKATIDKFNSTSAKQNLPVTLPLPFPVPQRFSMDHMGQHGEDAYMSKSDEGEYVLFVDIAEILKGL
jgi:NTP pyrophosphatase (non-canonical NTP hydrolase)